MTYSHPQTWLMAQQNPALFAALFQLRVRRHGCVDSRQQ
jgi:hypothetical protein